MKNRIRHALRAVLTETGSSRHRMGSTYQAEVSPRWEVQGVIQHVDPVSRLLPVLVDGISIDFFVPLGCSIFLNDEPVRMRMLRPNDSVELTYSMDHGVSRAHLIRVS